MSATLSEFPLAAEETSRWSEAAALYRRVCVLRARGQSVEAARLQSTELSQAVGSLRETMVNASDGETRLRALFALEAERVANASVLAELLLPLLREQLTVDRASVEPRRGPQAPQAAGFRRPPASAPGIADFIDEMIQQESAASPAGAP